MAQYPKEIRLHAGLLGLLGLVSFAKVFEEHIVFYPEELSCT
jgi:hypothetical protein